MRKNGKDMTKAVFFDIDGTLVSFRTHSISQNTLADLYALKEKGVKTFIASGRPLKMMDNLSGFPFDGYITLNGAIVYADDRVIFRHPIDAATAGKIAEIADTAGMPCVTYCEGRLAVSMTDETTDMTFKMIKLPPIPVIPAVEMAREPVYQFTIFADEKQEKTMILPEADKLEPSRWNPMFMDLNPKGLSKADGIRAICGHFGISREETMAFGDGGNDIEMLKYAGTGIAMGNASDNVKASADHVTASVDEDGVSKALRHFRVL